MQLLMPCEQNSEPMAFFSLSHNSNINRQNYRNKFHPSSSHESTTTKMQEQCRRSIVDQIQEANPAMETTSAPLIINIYNIV